MSSTARGTPPAAPSRSEQPTAASAKRGSCSSVQRARQTSARYAAAASASAPASGSGLSTWSPTPRAAAFLAFTGWSPKLGQTTTGVPCMSDSVKLFWPPCVRKRSTPALSSSTCGSTGAQSALAGASRSPRGLSCGPSETTSSGPAKASEAPKASKAPDQAAWQSSRPVRPRGLPSAPTPRPSQPTPGASPVMTVPMLTSTTDRPTSRAIRTLARISSPDGPGLPWSAVGPCALWPPAR
mmetsp:Transcript_95356/g.278817  ORF Transcript_95356/g.278817 Transcript_95356/m.278817 type:complete len:240 (+) Transcript_95356:325-1044(+)